MANFAKQGAKATVEGLSTARKRWQKAREASNALANIARHNGPLSATIVRRAKNDALERFGAARHAQWLMVYAAVRGNFCEGWLPDSYYLEAVMPRVNGTAHHLGRIRATNPVFFDSPAVTDLLYVLNGRFLGPGHAALTPDAAVEILRASGPRVVFKADHSGFGRGVHTIETTALDRQYVLNLCNGVVQPMITGHPSLQRLGGAALATLRIGTVLPDMGAPQVRTCYLKLGRPGHTHVIARDQIRVAVDWTSGALDSTGYLSDWCKVDQVPGSEVPFDGVTVPAMQEAINTVLHMHARLPLARYVCWDLAIDDAETVRLLEWEGGVVSFAEAVQGPCFDKLGWYSRPGEDVRKG
jgi:hypothetical protein